jgi:peptidoglycan/LPS O-acetylase OafA/YrhL
VDLFFLLSGYLCYAAWMRRRRSYGNYLWRRISRIYPAYFILFLIYLALSFLAPSVSKIPPQPFEAAKFLLANLLLLPGLFPIQPMISVSWVLSYQMISYAVIPLLAMLMQAWPRFRRVAVIVAIALALMAWYGMDQNAPGRLSAFAAGMLVWEMETLPGRRKLPTWVSWLAIPILCIMLWLMPITSWGLAGRFLMNFIFLPLLVLSVMDHPNARAARALSWTPLRWFGNISFSYFLTHALVMRIGSFLVQMIYPNWAYPQITYFAGLLISFPLTVIAALALYLTVERPVLFRKPVPVKKAVES